MAYTRVTNTKNGASAIRYALEEPTHKKGMDRVLMASGSNIDPRFAMMQMKATWDNFNKNDGKSVQMYRIIQSFGLDALDPNNPDDIETANEIGKALASELYPDRQALIITQADGEGGKLHNHVLVNSVSFIDGRSLRYEPGTVEINGEKLYVGSKEWDEISEKTNEIIQRHGLTPIDTENTRKRRSSQEKRLAEQGKYVWKDDLRGRIEQALGDSSVTSRDEFIERMNEDYGVTMKYEDSRKYITYSFDDANGTPRNSRDNKLGTDYNKKTVEERFQVNDELQKAEEQRKKEQTANTFGFDLGAELDSMLSGRGAKASKPTVYKESPIQKQVREEREKAKLEAEEAEKARQDAEFLAEIAQQEAAQREKEAIARQKVEEERLKADQARRAKEELEHAKLREKQREAAQREQAARNRMIARINHVAFPKGNISESMIDMFKELDSELEGRNHELSRKPYSDLQKYNIATMRISERQKAEQRGQVQRSVEISTQQEGPEM